MDAATGNDGLASDQSRRDALRKVGIGAAGAAAVWSAPVILSRSAAGAASAPGVGGCVGCGIENIVNGSFEDPQGILQVDPQGWSTTNGAWGLVYTQFPGFPAPPVPHGTQFGGLLFPASVMAQTFPVDPSCVGTAYAFSFWACSRDNASSAATLTFVGSNAPAVTVTVPPSSPPSSSLYAAPTAAIPAGTTSVTVTFTTQSELGIDLVSFIIGC